MDLKDFVAFFADIVKEALKLSLTILIIVLLWKIFQFLERWYKIAYNHRVGEDGKKQCNYITVYSKDLSKFQFFVLDKFGIIIEKSDIIEVIIGAFVGALLIPVYSFLKRFIAIPPIFENAVSIIYSVILGLYLAVCVIISICSLIKKARFLPLLLSIFASFAYYFIFWG